MALTGKTTSKKPKGLDRQNERVEAVDNVGTFVLPDSLSCSEVEFPVLINRRPKANWKQIVEDSEQEMSEIEAYRSEKLKEPIIKAPFLKTETDYIQNELFVQLIPAVEEMLRKARIWNVMNNHKCFFNGIDHVVQELWNNNPRYPQRAFENEHVFNFPWVRKYLKENPRPLYPKSWVWPEDYAATLIQKTFRQYLVQRTEEVQEMREFWRKLKEEKNMPALETNPLLSKKFASERI